LFASTSSINLLSEPIFKLGHVLFLIANCMFHIRGLYCEGSMESK
jgi:hypothetical protein